MIKDSGSRRTFETGAVRDIQTGKGRCDLMPLRVVAKLLNSFELGCIADFQESGNAEDLYACLAGYCNHAPFFSLEKMLLEVSKHFEEGANKYGENNWQKGIPVHCYIDSAIRHYLKDLAQEKDEPHERAFCWNILCAIWTLENKPELDDFTRKE